MPMYFPDLESVKKLAIDMSKHKGKEKYTGIIPQKESDLPQARFELAKYMREVWEDEVFAVEIEIGVDKENYHEKMSEALYNKLKSAQE